MKSIIKIIILIIGLITSIFSITMHLYSQESKTQNPSQEYSGELKNLLSSHKGEVLLLLLGRNDCPGTRKATAVLDKYVNIKPAEATIIRLDVPLPNETLKVDVEWNHKFSRILDKDRSIARQLDFFYYPTLCIFDCDGVLRFEGGCDKTNLDSIVKEILSEKQGQTKKNFTSVIPLEGATAPDFSGTTLAGENVALSFLLGEKGTLLFFAQTFCPFTIEELPNLAEIAKNFKDKGVKVIIVNRGEEKDIIRPIYEKYCPEIMVIWDKTEEISKAYGIDVTPYYFLLAPNKKIIKRRSFTAQAATNSLNAFLGIMEERPRYKSTEAG